MIEYRPGMSLGEFLMQECTDEEWDEMNPGIPPDAPEPTPPPIRTDTPPLAPPQQFIGPRAYPPKWLRCEGCQEWVQISDKYGRAKKAHCGRCGK